MPIERERKRESRRINTCLLSSTNLVPAATCGWLEAFCAHLSGLRSRSSSDCSTGNMDLILLLALVGLFYFLYKWVTARHDEFVVRGLPFEKPLPIFGNNVDVVMNRASFQKLVAEFYARTRQQ